MVSLKKYLLPSVIFTSGLVAGLALDSSAIFQPLVAGNNLSGKLLPAISLELSQPPKTVSAPVEQMLPYLFEQSAFKPAYVALGLGGVYFLIWIKRRRRRVAIKNFERKDSLSAYGAEMERIAVQMSLAAPVNLPRNLLENPFSDAIEGVDFETRVQSAITGSERHGRLLGVIHLGFRPTCVGDRAPDSRLRGIRLSAMQEELQVSLRSGDCVKVTGEGKISVIIPLLATRPDLEKIAARLYRVALKAGQELDLPVAYQPGCAMYPIDGYSAAELIEVAQEGALNIRIHSNSEFATYDSVLSLENPGWRRELAPVV